MIIETKNLKKVYRLKKALEDITFSVSENDVFGLIGPNGAGKSTMINILTGITDPTDGLVKLFGEIFTHASINLKKRIGVMPEKPALFSNLKVYEQIYFTGKIYGINKMTMKKRIDILLTQFDMISDQDKYVGELSAGVKKKLSFICAIIHGPALIILDEPFENTDPLSSQMIQDIICKLANKGRTIFLTSHNLVLIEKLCTHIAIINSGRIIMQGDTAGILDKIKSDRKGIEDEPLLEQLYFKIVAPDRKKVSLSWLD